MPTFYTLYQDNREKSLTRGKWYARAKSLGYWDLDKLADLYWLGWHDTEAALPRLKAYLGIDGQTEAPAAKDPRPTGTEEE